MDQGGQTPPEQVPLSQKIPWQHGSFFSPQEVQVLEPQVSPWVQ